jgi:hypothetical protein
MRSTKKSTIRPRRPEDLTVREREILEPHLERTHEP